MVLEKELRVLHLDLQFVYMVDYIDGFSYVEPSLHPWDEAYLIMVDDFSDMFLDSIHQYFIEYLASMFMRDIGLDQSCVDLVGLKFTEIHLLLNPES
ncbi:hypothetical protein H671_2g6668 [Cricetulus griseus]|uniref:Uncharacterized protein n=1 Tax=Cricetulus griseus TaxID=10029 RepID=A0A061IDT7_CRIGR|nr:hypothetical protein H671_2g6668 [Cricetulus griseus]